MNKLTSVEICAGAGGQALGLEQAGFEHAAVVEIDKRCCATLLFNRPSWNVLRADVNEFDGSAFKGIDLLAGGVPCPPFSVAGKQFGEADERNLFPAAVRLISEMEPGAVLLENVRGLNEKRFDDYRASISASVGKLGYTTAWKILKRVGLRRAATETACSFRGIAERDRGWVRMARAISSEAPNRR